MPMHMHTHGACFCHTHSACSCLQEEAGDLREGSELAAAWRPEVRVVTHDLAASLRRHARHAPDLPVVKQLGL